MPQLINRKCNVDGIKRFKTEPSSAKCGIESSQKQTLDSERPKVLASKVEKKKDKPSSSRAFIPVKNFPPKNQQQKPDLNRNQVSSSFGD